MAIVHDDYDDDSDDNDDENDDNNGNDDDDNLISFIFSVYVISRYFTVFMFTAYIQNYVNHIKTKFI